MFPCQLCLRKRDLRTIGAAGNIIIDMGVLLSEDFDKSEAAGTLQSDGQGNTTLT
jgi:hypothetical protein